ncbi:glycosyltransferase [Phenylobacterium sp. J426]|uniref:glycosyltransferase n=1 Tax=Phenylobacterium sp. J426 TaxID=2898439 RepID=UPI002151483A|nr:glycosyltransferase [Phenylobacterium sp. J426]MCR5876461.1 glycosyltransferase [Phenylobacterium sp. J426]
MPDRLVSIVVINYNYGVFLTRSISSALAQDWPEVQVVVVDDASTDGSQELIRGFGDRITPVLQDRNRGHGAAMNAGFAAARGDIVLFLDADDYLYGHAVRTVAQSAAAGEAIAQYQYRLHLVDAEGRILDAYPPLDTNWSEGDVRSDLLTRGRYATTVTSGLAFSRAALESILPMDEAAFAQGGDGYLVTVAPFYGRVKAIDEVLGAYCQHGGNHSQFSALVAERARWRLAHDRERLTALADHARRSGLTITPEICLEDPLHLEERVASLLLAPQLHPNPRETRAFLAGKAIGAAAALPVTPARRAVIRAWWLVIGFAPASLARRAVSWKLQASTRPAYVRVLARGLRRLTGLSRRGAAHHAR